MTCSDRFTAAALFALLVTSTVVGQEESNTRFVVDDPVNALLIDTDHPITNDATTENVQSTPAKIINVNWASANSQHKRLYFEEKLLERHGIHDGEIRTNLRSARRFFTRAIGWPIASRIFKPADLQSPYSMRRPGSPKTR